LNNATVNGQPRIVVSGAGKRYGALQVFQGVDFEVGERDVLTIIGPSGCGKTTLLRCIDGLIPLTEGGITMDGEPITAPREGVAMVFQHFGLFPWKTVFQNVAYGLKLAGASRAEIDEKVPGFINLVGLSGFEDYYPYQISGRGGCPDAGDPAVRNASYLGGPADDHGVRHACD